jgi:uncharacterized repeat protein (TIGR01451 family)/fimbrial isopeptide formation D2 family protein
MGMKLGWRRLTVGAVALLASPALAVLMAFPTASAGDPPVDPPVPVVSVSTTGSPLVGQSVGIDLTFVNASTANAGYGPYVDLRLPLGADGYDGLTFEGATYLGAAVTATQLVATGTAGPEGSACVTHPYAVDASGAPVQVCGLADGQSYVVLRLPFGSFTAGQPAATVHVTTQLSDLADAGTALQIVANGGFQFGADALADPATDPSIVGATAAASISPTVMTVRKTYLGPEDETATGKDFPEAYRIDVIVAPGQTVTDLTVSDVLPDNMQYVSVDATTPDSDPLLTPATTAPGGTLSRDFGTVEGTGGTDATITFHFYIPRMDAASEPVLDASSGAFAPSVDSAGATASWTPIDPNDATGPVSAGPATHTLTDKSVAIQKSVAISHDTGPAGASPGDTLQWTLHVEVSDYFALDNLKVDDLLGDGTRVDDSFAPTLSVSGNGFSSDTAPFDGANLSIGAVDPGMGKTPISFRVSDELITRGRSTGRLVGGCILLTGSAAPDCGTYDAGGTTVTIVFRSIVQQTYVDGTTEVVEGDTLGNLASVTADVLDTSTFSVTGSNIGDGSAAVATAGTSASITIARGTLEKSIYAIDGHTDFATPVHVSPGDTVTYRLKQTFPTSRTDDFRMIDYLPLPVFYAAGVTSFDPTVSADAPPAGTAKYGPDDKFSALSNGPSDPAPTPVVTSDTTANSVTFTYGDFALYDPAASISDLLFTVTVSTNPFADGLLLTNQARSQTRNSQGTLSTADAIVQITLDQPVLSVTKGVVATDGPNAVLTPATPGPVTFGRPSAHAAVSCPGWSGGAVTSDGLAATPVDSNLSGVDAGDFVRYAIVVENTGHSDAFQVQIADTLPAGLTVPAGKLDLCVQNGAGAAIATTNVDGGLGLFDKGIQLDDGAAGSLAAGFAGTDVNATGTNVAVVSFTLQVGTSAVPGSVITNTASLIDFTNRTGAAGHLASPLTDTATVALATPSASKAAVADSLASTVRPAVAIGEIVTYRVTLTMPEGTLPNATVTDALPDGMALVDCLSVAPYSNGLATSDVTTSLPGGFSDACHATGTTPPPLDPVVAGQNVVFDLGTVVNSNTDNSATETLVITYDAVVLNTAGNTRGTLLHNGAVLAWDGGSIAAASAGDLRVVEPWLTVTKSAGPTTGDAGDTIVYTVTVSNPTDANGSDAFDVGWSDTLPAGMTFVSGSFSQTDGPAPTHISDSTDPAMAATWDVFPQGDAATFQFTTTLDGTVYPGQVLTNESDAVWTSLPEDVTAPQSTFSAVSTERTGDTGNPGGVVNDYRAAGTADVTVPDAAISKSMTGGNLAHPSGTAVSIGEILTYQVVVTIPEGTTPSATLTDTLPTGMALYDCQAISASAGLSTDLDGGFDAACHASGAAPLDPTVAGQYVVFDLGSITNAARSNGTPETITITYRAVVLNVGSNVRGAAMHNGATFAWAGGTAGAATPDVRVVEPMMTVAKSASPGNGDAGDTITFSVLISNPLDGFGSDAYDAVWKDAIPSGLTYVADSLHAAGGCTAVPTSLVDGAAPNLTATWTTFAQGATCTLQYQATFDAGVPSGSSYTNTATQTWTSMPGDLTTPQGPFSSVATERTGNAGDPGGDLNNYSASGSSTVSVNQPAPVKTVVTTSEAGTTDSTRLEIGEIVRYRVAVTIPEGVTPNVSIHDTLPLGLRYLNDNSTRVAFVTDGAGMISSTLSDPSLAASGTDTWLGHPTYVLPGAAISGGSGGTGSLDSFQSGDDPVFALGTLTNLDRDPNAELVVIEFNVLVDNVATNQAGTNLPDRASIWAGSTPANLGDSGLVTEVVAEPNIVNGTSFYKQITTSPVDAGDVIAYKITVTNTAGTNTSPAYEYAVTDTLPASVAAPGAPTVVCANGYTDASVGSSIAVTFTRIDPGTTCTITISTTVGTLERAGKTFVNTANGAYSSLPGTTGTPDGSAGNATGSTNPGTSGSATGERTGTGGVGSLNDYVNTNGVSKTLAAPSIAKNVPTLVSTPIGASTTFDLVVTLPEGTTSGLAVTDVLPVGLNPVSYQVITDAASSGGRLSLSFSGTLATPTETAKPNLTGGGGNWTITFGDTVVPVNGIAGDEKFLVRITAQIYNMSGNHAGVTRTNTASVAYTNPQSGPTNINAPTPRTVTIYEPALTIAKTVSASNPRFGDVITYTLTISHVGGTYDMAAYDVTLVDTLPLGLTYVDLSLVQTAGPTPTTSVVSNGVISIGYDVFALGTTSTFQYQATVGGPGTVELKQPLVNAAAANWTSLPGNVAGERTGADGVGGLNGYRALSSVAATVSGVDMAITKDDGQANATAGALRSYAVGYANNGNQPATGVVITETVPTGSTFNAGASTGTWTGCSDGAAAGTVCHLTVASVAAMATGSYTFAVDVVDPIPAGLTEISNTATIADDGTHGVEPTPLDNTATDVDQIQQANLSLTKTVDAVRPGADQLVTYTVTLHNAGPADATGVTVKDLVPGKLTYAGAVASQGTYDSGTGVWTVSGTVVAGSSKTLTITAHATSSDAATNAAEVTHSDQGDPNSTPDNHVVDEDDYATATTTPTIADMAVTKTVDVASPDEGSNVTFTITATNNGPDDATNVHVADALPAGLTFVSATPSAGAWDGDTWTVGTLDDGATATLTLVAHVAAAGPITNTATVGADPFDPVESNNSDSAAISQSLDLAVTKTVDDPTPNVGAIVAFSVAVSNSGPNSAHNVVIHDALPAGLTFVSAAPSQGTYDAGTGNWDAGTISPSSPVTMIIQATVTGHAAMTNTASVASLDEAQTSLLNDAASATVTPQQADLAVAKTVDVIGPEIGDPIQFTVSVTNNGPDAATNVVVADALPAGLTFVSAAPTQGDYDHSAGIWTVGSMARGATVSMVVDATVALGGSYTNTATVSGDQYDPEPANNVAHVSLTSRTADIAVTKTVDDSTPNVGDTVTYTVTVTNNGPDPASQLVVTDAIPDGLTLVSAAPDRGTYVAATGAWTIGNLALNGSVSMVVKARVTASGRIDNVVAVTALLQTDPVSTNDSATATIDVPAAADLAVAKTVDVAHPDVGSNVTYTVTATNNGPDDATGVKVTDVLPAGLSFVSADPAADWAGDTWTVGALDDGASATLTLVATVADPGTIKNTATVGGNQYDPEPANNSASVSFDQLVDLAVKKTVDDATPNVGGIATFTVTVSNLGPGTATGVVINDPVPTGLSFVGNTPSQGDYSAAGGVWNVGTIADGASATLQIQALVVGSGAMTNTASVAAVDEPQTSSANDEGSATVTPPQADLAVVKTVSQVRPDVGDSDTFTVTLMNHGSDAATNVAVTDLLPAGLTWTASSASQGGYDHSSGIWTVGTLASGATATLTIEVTVDVAGDYTNTAAVSASDQYDPDPSNNSGSADLTTRKADIAVTKTAGNPAPKVGTSVDFTITATNNGPDAASQLVVHDALPSGLTYVSDSGGGAYNPTTGDWTIGALANGDSTSLTITARVTDSGSITNTAAVGHLLQRDDVPGNNSDSATIDVPKAADLSLTKTVDNDEPNAGSNVTFTLTVANAGPNAAGGIVVHDPLPAGLTYVSDTGQGAYDPATGDWAVGGLSKGDTASLDITALVNVESPIVNTAEITASSLYDPDSTPGNGVVGEDDEASATLNAGGVANLSLSKTVNETKVVIGGRLTYTLVLTNHGPDQATGVIVRDSLPAGVTYVSSAGGTYNHTTGAWTVGSLASGDSATLTVTVRDGVAGSIVNTAEVVAETQRDPNSTPDNHNPNEDDQSTVSLLSSHATPPPTEATQSSAPAPQGPIGFVLVTIALAAGGIFLLAASRRYTPARVKSRPRRRR